MCQGSHPIARRSRLAVGNRVRQPFPPCIIDRSAVRKGADMAATSDKDRAQNAVDDAFEIAVQGLFRMLDRELKDNPAEATAASRRASCI